MGGLIGLEPEVLIKQCTTDDRQVFIAAMYEFTCRRTFVDGTGRPFGHETVIVEIDGSHADDFNFKVRLLENHET